MKRLHYGHTIAASYIGYITQAVINNFAPLLFLTFQRIYALRLEQVTVLVTVNFLVQLLVDFISAEAVDRIGYRISIVAAHVVCAVGLVGLAVFPLILPSAYAGLLTAVVLYAVGGGLLEVLVSPIVQACPTDSKSAAMSLLHSFYCWGTVLVVALSTAFFACLGMEHWKLVACFWALIPAVNAVFFALVPIADIVPQGQGMTMGQLLRKPLFWGLAFLIFCAGAAEQSMVQWASAFAEGALHVTKSVGDLAGPCLFSVLMGLSRVLHAKLADRIRLEPYMACSAILCIISYAMAVLLQSPALNLLGCGLCGFSVGVLWPGNFSVAAARIPLGGTAMFALLALAGDAGCSFGPTLVGMVAGLFEDNLKIGLGFAVLFPIGILVGLRHLRAKN